jgi:putative Mg2+ transporter-C (MgtC) family protein
MNLELIWPVIGSLVAGGLIGLEREFRGHPAGFRTHILVCFTSTILMLAAARQAQWDIDPIPGQAIVTDPTRMAHGVLTGIGFLCAGVIFREGFSIHGLTTAASLWITSAIGILFGVGLVELGGAAATLTLMVLAGLRLLDNWLPRRGAADLRISYVRERALSEESLLALLKELGIRTSSVAHSLTDEGRVVEHAAVVRSNGHLRAAQLATRLQAMPEVLGFSVVPRAV